MNKQPFLRSCVRVVSSSRAGMGKTLFVARMEEELKAVKEQAQLITIPVHGPVVTTDSIMQCLVHHQSTCDAANCVILHFDISPLVC